MAQLVLQLHPSATCCDEDVCAVCGGRIVPGGGPELRLADSRDVVCRDCGKRHAPSLVALLDLARTAERVGRIGRHSVCPPLTALLELARAAENYSTSHTRRQAA